MRSRIVKLLFFLIFLLAVNLGLYVWRGDDEAPRPPAIPESLITAAETGTTADQIRLADRFVLTATGPADFQAARQWYNRAAGAGDPAGLFGLAQLLDEGREGRADPVAAARLYTQAARLANHPPSQFFLGRLYFEGRGVKQDYAEAMAWYEKAAANGHAAAQFILGAMAEDGWGREADRVAAYGWYARAAEHRDAAMAVDAAFDPDRALTRLIPKMSQSQLRRARAIAQP